MTFLHARAGDCGSARGVRSATVLDPRLASALNKYLASPLRVEIDEIVMIRRTGQVNLTVLAKQIQAQPDDLASLPTDRLRQSRISEGGDLRFAGTRGNA